MIIAGSLPDSSTVTVGYDAAAGGLSYSVEAKPLPAGATTPRGGKRPINLDPMGYMVDEPSDDDDDDDEMRD
jgi:hypothetical protein